ncbi:MAG: primosomal protein N' [Nitrospirae bacterium]|nr:primosomal protein N' [Nitrospirota bacterium]
MYAQLAFPRAVHKLFDYRVPEDLVPALRIGQRLRAPLGKAEAIGFLVGLSDRPACDPAKLKPLREILDPEPLLPEDLFSVAGGLARWMAEYYLAPLGLALDTAFPKGIRGTPDLTPQPVAVVSRQSSVVSETSINLTPAQETAVTRIREALAEGKFAPFLLHGVTGSGKTEIYLRAIAALQGTGKGAIVLVPEIALTPQMVGRFRERFGEGVAVLHSRLTANERKEAWLRIRRGEATVAVGARSAVFAPFLRLGLIIVDEEQDSSYKQEEGVRYQARDLAVVRAKLAGAPVVLGSATPSLESYRNAETGKYMLLTLPDRIDGRRLPDTEIVDLRGSRDPLSSPLREALHAVIQEGGQAILFLNRRGYAPFLLCRECGHVPACRHCAVSLTVHRGEGKLRCHYCGYEEPLPTVCSGCGGVRVEARGLGTERVEGELRGIFPGAPLARMDRDTVRKKGAYEAILGGMERGEHAILLGTQMVAKGHDFPGVTLAGVLLAEGSLHLPDFRSAERTFQLITQAGGRAGRGVQPGRVIIQTYCPDHYALRHAARHDFPAFYREELAYREEAGYPPFRRLIAFSVRGAKEDRVQAAAQALREALGKAQRQARGVEILGPAPAPLSRLRGKHRWQILLKGRDAKSLHRLAGHALRELGESVRLGSCTVEADVDPQSLM